MQQYLVSLIIPIYNTEQYLKQCIDSVLQQTYQNLEIILVDDGSTDHSGLICDHYIRQDSRIKVIHKKNGGLVSAWQAGVRASTGMYLMFLDSDDWIDAEMTEALLQQVDDTSKMQMICCNYMLEKEKQNKSIPVMHQLQPGVYEGEELESTIKSKLLGEERRTISFSRCMKLFSKSLIKNNMIFCDERIVMGEDVSIVLPAILDSDRIVILEESFYYHYRFVESSMVHKYNPKLEENIHLLYERMLAAIREKRPQDERIREQAGREYLYLLFLVIKNEVRGNRNYRRNIRRICTEPAVEQLLHDSILKPADVKNQLIYRVMKHPNFFYSTFLWGVTRFYDGK